MIFGNKLRHRTMQVLTVFRINDTACSLGGRVVGPLNFNQKFLSFKAQTLLFPQHILYDSREVTI